MVVTWVSVLNNQFEPITFQMLNSHAWLVLPALEATVLEWNPEFSHNLIEKENGTL